jgi:hypothetical protein
MARTEGARSVLALLACAGALALAASQDRPADKPLVRKDLLVFGRAEITPPLRDIFRPVTAAPGMAPVRVRPAVRTEAGTPAAETPPSFNLNISYIGSVKSGGQMLALILRGGQTESVRQGDEIVPGYKVINLTTEAIVVQGPTGETRTFQKQGDRP